MKRFFHHAFARVFGYFWLPCKGCGQWFGGHEVARSFRRGHVCIACPEENGQFGLLVCPACCIGDEIPGKAVPTGHLLYLSLYSGMVAKIDGNLIGLPPVSLADFIYWGRMRMLSAAIYPVVLLLVVLGYNNAWANVGIMLGFSLGVVCNRVTPFTTRYPAMLVFIQSINIAMVILHLVLAWSRWGK
jgi:hypothetical protein